MNAVAAGAAAENDNKVAVMRPLVAAVHGYQTHRAAKNQRIAQISFVEKDGAVYSRNTNAVAVVAHASDDAGHDFARVQHAGGQRLRRHIGRGKAEDIGVANWLGAQTGAEYIANYAAEAGIRSAIRLDGGRMI